MVGRENSDKDELPHLLEWRHYRHLEQGLESSLVALAVAQQKPSPQESETEESKAIAKAKARQAAQIKHANRKEIPKKGIYYPIAERSWRPRDSSARWVPDQQWEAHLTHLDPSQSEPLHTGQLESAHDDYVTVTREEDKARRQLADYKDMLLGLTTCNLPHMEELMPVIERLAAQFDGLYVASQNTADLPDHNRPYRKPSSAKKYHTKPPVPRQSRRPAPAAAAPPAAAPPSDDLLADVPPPAYADRPRSLTAEAVDKILAAGGAPDRHPLARGVIPVPAVGADANSARASPQSTATPRMSQAEAMTRKAAAERALWAEQQHQLLREATADTATLTAHLGALVGGITETGGVPVQQRPPSVEAVLPAACAPVPDDVVERMKNKPPRHAGRRPPLPEIGATAFLGRARSGNYMMKQKQAQADNIQRQQRYLKLSIG
jgi:hypothetical protein